MFRPFMLAGAIAAFSLQAASHPAMAQQPTQAQRDAIRASCRSDFMANCSSVTPGGKEALECLLRNQAKLSAACNAAVSAVVPAKPAPAEAPASAEAPAAKSEPAAPPGAASEPAPKSAASQEAQLKSVRQACTLNDFMAHCSWIKPDNPELVLCLQSNASDLSPSCQAAVQGAPPAAAPEKKPAAAAPAKKPVAVREPAPPSAPPPAASAAPTEAQKSAIRAACRSDFMANCSGVQPGGAEAFQCLKGHAASLSSACQSAVAAIGGGAPAPAASAAPAAAPSEAQKSAIRSACRSDFMANCSGVQPGGAEALQCLKSHAASLSSACQGAVAAIGGGAAPANMPTPAVAPLGPIPPMLPREALRILAMCRPEQESLCSGVPIGGGRILTCLADHAQQLSLECYQALARVAR